MLTATSVSIHAPRVGRDHELDVAETRIHCFNPRAPCGARPRMNFYQATKLIVSIHAPRVGRDLTCNDVTVS